MAVPGSDAVERELGDLGTFLFYQNETGLRRADLSDCSRYRAGQSGAIGDGGLRLRFAVCNRIDQIGIDQKRRIFEHPRRDFWLVHGKTENNGWRSMLAKSQRP